MLYPTGPSSTPRQPRFKWPAEFTLPVRISTTSMIISATALIVSCVNVFFTVMYVRDDLKVLVSDDPHLFYEGVGSDGRSVRVQLRGVPQFKFLSGGNRTIVVSGISMSVGLTCETDSDSTLQLVTEPVRVPAGDVVPVKVTEFIPGRFSGWQVRKDSLGPTSTFTDADAKLLLCFNFELLTADGVKAGQFQQQALIPKPMSHGHYIPGGPPIFNSPTHSIYHRRQPF